MKEREDIELANRQARQEPQPKGAAPHYYRCNWFRGLVRCLLADKHTGLHQYPENAA